RPRARRPGQGGALRLHGQGLGPRGGPVPGGRLRHGPGGVDLRRHPEALLHGRGRRQGVLTPRTIERGMAATVPKRVEPFVVAGGLKGQLSQLPIPEILNHLRLSRATGILTLVSGGARKAVYLREGRVVFASSNLPNDRLGEILIREGKITVEEYEASIKAISRGKRQGRVLVEMGALSPKDLWAGVQFQVQEI